MWQLAYPFAALLVVFIIESLLEAIDDQAVRPFDLSIGPWVCNRNILTSMHAFLQNSQNWLAVKFDPKSVMMVFGKLKRCKILEMKSTTRSGVSLPIGLYSIHLVNLSIATNKWVKPPGAIVKGPIISRLQQAKGQDGGMVMRLWAGT
jgi:hypothetical protein